MSACPADSPLTPAGFRATGEEPPAPGALHSSPPGVLNPEPPNIARIYDALLGGKDNYPADRQAARELAAAVPGAAQAARENRAFLGRAVRFLATRHGISQFLDIGTGLPTREHVHQTARRVNPGVRVVYADNDPAVVVHARALLAGQPGVTAVAGDVRAPRDLLTSPELREALDFTQPVGALLVAVLHFVADEQDPWAAVRCIVDHLAPGSFLVISHVTGDEIPADAVKRAEGIYAGAQAPGTARSRAEVTRFFDGTEVTGAGITDAATWHAARRAAAHRPVLFWAGVGRKPGQVQP
jgi:SAM-dependent methyltransferase